MTTIALTPPESTFEGALITGQNYLPAMLAQLRAFPFTNTPMIKPTGILGTMFNRLSEEAVSLGDFGSAANRVGREFLAAYMTMSELPVFDLTKVTDVDKLRALILNYGASWKVLGADLDNVVWIIWYMKAGSADRRYRVVHPGTDVQLKMFLSTFVDSINISQHYSDIDKELDAYVQVYQAQSAITLLTRITSIRAPEQAGEKGLQDWEGRRRLALRYAMLLLGVALVGPIVKATAASQFLLSPITLLYRRQSGLSERINTVTDLSDILSFDVFGVNKVVQYTAEGRMAHMGKTSKSYVFTEAVYTSLLTSYAKSTAAYLDGRDPEDPQLKVDSTVDLAAKMKKTAWGMVYEMPDLESLDSTTLPLTQKHGSFLPEIWSATTLAAAAEYYDGILESARNEILSSTVYNLATGQSDVKAIANELKEEGKGFGMRSIIVNSTSAASDRAPRVMSMRTDNANFSTIADMFQGPIIPYATNFFSERRIADVTKIFASHLVDRMKVIAKENGVENWQPQINFFYDMDPVTATNLNYSSIGDLPGIMPNCYRHAVEDMDGATPHTHTGLAVAMGMDAMEMRGWFRSRLIMSTNPEAEPAIRHYTSAFGLLFYTDGMDVDQMKEIPWGLQNPEEYEEKFGVSVYSGWREPPNQYVYGVSIKEWLVASGDKPGRAFNENTPIIPLDKSKLEYSPSFCLVPYSQLPSLPLIDSSATSFATDFMSKRIPDLFIPVSKDTPKFMYEVNGFSNVHDQLAFRRVMAISAGVSADVGSVLLSAEEGDYVMPLWLQTTDAILSTVNEHPVSLKSRGEGFKPSPAIQERDVPPEALRVGFIGKVEKIWSF